MTYEVKSSVTNRQHSGKPPLREVTASLGPPSATLGGAAREQYAAMEAGGGAVEAHPKKKKGQLKDRPAAGHRGRKSVEMTATKRISDVLFPRGFEVASPRRSLQSTRMPSSCIRRSMYPRRKKFYFFFAEKRDDNDELYQTRGLAPRVRWRYTSRHDTQQQTSAAATAAAARAKGNEINTDRRSNALLTCQFPVF
jgi:hypothetical protein